jgi:hypothetical protein
MGEFLFLAGLVGLLVLLVGVVCVMETSSDGKHLPKE